MDLIKCANCNQTIFISIPHEKKYCAVSKCAFHEKKDMEPTSTLKASKAANMS